MITYTLNTSGISPLVFLQKEKFIEVTAAFQSLYFKRQKSSSMCELLPGKPWGRWSHKDHNKETEVGTGESIIRTYSVIKKKQNVLE